MNLLKYLKHIPLVCSYLSTVRREFETEHFYFLRLNQPAVMYCNAVCCPVSPAVRRTDELLTGCRCVSTATGDNAAVQGCTPPQSPSLPNSSYLFIIDNTNSTGRRRLPPAGRPRLYSLNDGPQNSIKVFLNCQN